MHPLCSWRIRLHRGQYQLHGLPCWNRRSLGQLQLPTMARSYARSIHNLGRSLVCSSTSCVGSILLHHQDPSNFNYLSMQSCTSCPPGYKQPIPGQATCVACEAGFYSPVGEFRLSLKCYNLIFGFKLASVR